MIKEEGEEMSEERRKLDYETPPKIPGRNRPLWTELILGGAMLLAIILLLVLGIVQIQFGRL